jgi:hypothetical protein
MLTFIHLHFNLWCGPRAEERDLFRLGLSNPPPILLKLSTFLLSSLFSLPDDSPLPLFPFRCTSLVLLSF